MFSCSEEREPKLDWGASFPTSDDSIIRCGEPSGGLVLPHSAEGLGSPREGRAPVPRAQPAARGGQDEAGHGVVDPPLDQSPAPDGLTEVALPPGDLDLSDRAGRRVGLVLRGGVAAGVPHAAHLRELATGRAEVRLVEADHLRVHAVVLHDMVADGEEGDAEEGHDGQSDDSVEHLTLSCDAAWAEHRVIAGLRPIRSREPQEQVGCPVSGSLQVF